MIPFSNDPEMLEILESFFIETDELLENFSQDLMILESHPDDLELLNKIFRSIHTIKGTSSFMGFDKIQNLTHHAEDLLNKLRKGELKASVPIFDCLLEVHDWVRLLVDNVKNGVDTNVDYQNTINQIEILRHPAATTETIEDKSNTSKIVDVPENSKTTSNEQSALESILNNSNIGNHSGDFTDEELELIQAAFAEVNKDFNQEHKPESISKNLSEINDIKPVIENIQSEAISAIKEETKPIDKKDHIPGSTKAQSTETIRVDVNRLEVLMDLSGELVLGRNRLAQITEIMDQDSKNKDKISDLIETTAQIDFITSEIQAAVMRMRMVAIGKLYQKVPRIVRDLSKEFSKKINLVLKGEETEIDRGIIDELNDPLVHMIRNSCDHGIETPEQRMAAGKSPEGTITLDAEQEGNNIVLRIIDDGKGLDSEKLKAKGIERGLITAEAANQMSKREIFQLIFAPGFSMAAKVTNVSGRGVGMDVVRTNIQKLKGIIDIDSEVGKGTTFTIKLPLTLAIIQGLLVKVKNETYAIPLSTVVEVVSVDLDKVYYVNQKEVIRIREDVLPLLRLDRNLGVKDANTGLENRYVVVVGLGTNRLGFVVDELLGQQEIVIKSLGDYLGHISGIAGATIMGDGRVIMIIDASEVLEKEYEMMSIH
jgi:two-component system chemotaxis sensor kinase CheA